MPASTWIWCWEAERLGFDAVWAGEAYGTDAVSPVAWVLARTSRIKAGTSIMQMPARTPACAAMTAMTLQALSGNRFLCGIGPSGPQVVEGWHGVPFGKPLARTREYVAIIRQVLERKAPLEHHGEHYQIPYTGPGSTGLGKPLRSIIHGDPSLKIYTASVSPAGLRTAGEVADGVLPFFMSPEKAEAIVGPILEGPVRKPASRATSPISTTRPMCGSAWATISPNAATRCGPASRSISAGWGRGRRNFYNDLAKRIGYEAAAAEIQDLFLAGKRNEAAAAVPDALIDEISLIGPPERIRDRLQAWQEIAEKELGRLAGAGRRRCRRDARHRRGGAVTRLPSVSAPLPQAVN